MAEVDREFFTKDVGPWPMWVWILGGVAGMYLWERVKGSSKKPAGQGMPAGAGKQGQAVNDGTTPTAQAPAVFLLPQGMTTDDATRVQGGCTGNSGVNSGNPPGSSGGAVKARPGSGGTSA
ncbi:membrane protein [Streptomyces noursei ATCC 11455]|nr:membrane protein [Streptomyces noursei ATCC 11455]